MPISAMLTPQRVETLSKSTGAYAWAIQGREAQYERFHMSQITIDGPKRLFHDKPDPVGPGHPPGDAARAAIIIGLLQVLR